MKRLLILAALASPLVLAGCSDHSYNHYPPPQSAVDNVAARGYDEGYEAARRDVRSQRPPDMRHHPNFRNPPVPSQLVDEYRRAFRNGYDAFLHNGPPRDRRDDGPPPPPPPQYR